MTSLISLPIHESILSQYLVQKINSVQDYLAGGLGDDVYYVDFTDTFIEDENGGTNGVVDDLDIDNANWSHSNVLASVVLNNDTFYVYEHNTLPVQLFVPSGVNVI